MNNGYLKVARGVLRYNILIFRILLWGGIILVSAIGSVAIYISIRINQFENLAGSVGIPITGVPKVFSKLPTDLLLTLIAFCFLAPIALVAHLKLFKALLRLINDQVFTIAFKVTSATSLQLRIVRNALLTLILPGPIIEALADHALSQMGVLHNQMEASGIYTKFSATTFLFLIGCHLLLAFSGLTAAFGAVLVTAYEKSLSANHELRKELENII